MSKKLKVGIIGLGGIANLHVGGWKASEHAEIAAGCDINPGVFERWEVEHGIKYLTTDPDELINNPELDIIDICSPNNFHASQTIAALDAGKHVMCEKPLAPTVDEIRQMIAARDRAGKLLMTGHHFRFTGTARALKSEIDAGSLGDIYHARAWWLRRAEAPIRPTFIYKKQAYAGVGLDLGVHVIDLVLWFMGNPQPISVTGVARTELALQFSSAFVRFENGASLIIEVSWLLHHGTDKDDVQTWLYGTRAGAHWPKCEIYETNNALKQQYNRILKSTDESRRPHHQEIVEFAKAIVDGGTSPVPSESSLQVQMILEALYKSQETGREVLIPSS
jgi:predicted dehydrogenase